MNSLTLLFGGQYVHLLKSKSRFGFLRANYILTLLVYVLILFLLNYLFLSNSVWFTSTFIVHHKSGFISSVRYIPFDFFLYPVYESLNTVAFPYLYYLRLETHLVQVYNYLHGGFMSYSLYYPIDFTFSSNYYKLAVRLNFIFIPLSVKTTSPMIQLCHPALLFYYFLIYVLVNFLLIISLV